MCRVLGLISGTSVDAIDAALAELRLTGDVIELAPGGHTEVGYPPDLRDELLAAGSCNPEQMCRLDTRIGQSFANAAATAIRELGQADVIASLGQTVYHWVEDGICRGTLQLGQPAWIAEKTGLPVISDLRARDVAAGGHGAPLAGLFDRLWLQDDVALNIGGIANITLPSDNFDRVGTFPGTRALSDGSERARGHMRNADERARAGYDSGARNQATDDDGSRNQATDNSGGRNQATGDTDPRNRAAFDTGPHNQATDNSDLHNRAMGNTGPHNQATGNTGPRNRAAFDTGPGNALLDAAAEMLTGQRFDKGGALALAGTVRKDLLDLLLEDPYYRLPAPKSTGKEHFNIGYLKAALAQVPEVTGPDLMATLVELTAVTIADACAGHRVVASGGGVRNPALMAALARHLDIVTSDALGIPSDAKEAYLTALLGFLTWHGIAADPRTGADGPRLLGSITPGRDPLRMPAPATTTVRQLRVVATLGGSLARS
ncbi:anhydro-N-acetylmuramic acid kinase [Kibdelosporangium aridum]|uniref:anhydro-N-acetylmuramic acid kinase n=1 Tax=Kibdelosporangium aridum TaxID=2030 RepID=UPI001F29138B|nr:anhydro-N-acetylmuramic acid kinase [Kibdelosporangium aridum]